MTEPLEDEPKADAGVSRREYEGDRSADKAALAERRKDPGPTGEEYEAFKRETRIRTFLTGVILVGTLVLATLALVDAFTNTERDDAVAICELGREIDQAIIGNELEGLERSDPELFPDIPPETFEELLEEAKTGFQELQERADPARCAVLLDG